MPERMCFEERQCRAPGSEANRFYRSWSDMKSRCDNYFHQHRRSYGGRGITYDPRWAFFKNFFLDMFDTWSPGMTLDRKDNDGNYCKDNCQWLSKADHGKKSQADR